MLLGLEGKFTYNRQLRYHSWLRIINVLFLFMVMNKSFKLLLVGLILVCIAWPCWLTLALYKSLSSLNLVLHSDSSEGWVFVRIELEARVCCLILNSLRICLSLDKWRREASLGLLASWEKFVLETIWGRRSETWVPLNHLEDEVNCNRWCTLHWVLKLLNDLFSAWIGHCSW